MPSINTFLQNEIIRRKRNYVETPYEICRDYNFEKEKIQAYNGRQILEMLQNANDACESSESKKAYIKLEENVLFIANNGEPFGEDGFISILRGSISAKTNKKNKIGEKGLGFRSILSWAEEIIINTDFVSVGFSETYAKQFLHGLITNNPNACIEETNIKFTGSKDSIATLTIPNLQPHYSNSLPEYETTIVVRL